MTFQIGQEIRPNQAVAVGQAPGKEDFAYGQVSQTAPAKIKNMQTINGEVYYDIDQTGIGGGTGWVKGSALEAAMGGGGSNPSASGATSGAIAAMNGSNASLNIQDLYKQLYETPEMADINKKISEAEQKRLKAQEDFNLANAGNNDNPWLSETMRRGEAAKIKEKFDAEDMRLNMEKATYADQLAKKKADAEVKLNLALKQYDINRQEYQDNISRFNMLLTSGALTNASGADIAQLSVSTGIPTSMLDSIIAKQKRGEVETQAITAEDDYGNQTVTFIDKNDPTKIVAQHKFTGVSKKTAGSGTGYDKISDQYLDNALAILKESDTLAQRQGGESNPGEDKGLSVAEVTAARNRIRALVKDPAQADAILDRAWDAGGYWLAN